MVKVLVMTAWIRRVQCGGKVKDQDVDEAHEENEEVYSKDGVLHVERFVMLRDEEVGGLDMGTTDEDLVLRGA